MRVRYFSVAFGLFAGFSAIAGSETQAQVRLSTGTNRPQSLSQEEVQQTKPLTPAYRGRPHNPFDDLNLNLILTPDLLYGWGSNSGYYNGGNSPSAAGGYSQPVLDQPPFYYGQPAPNYYSAPPPGAWPQSQYITPNMAPGVTSGRNPPAAAEAYNAPAESPPTRNSLTRESQRPATTAATPERVPQRRKSILVRPESAPTLRRDLAADSPGRPDYEISLAAFAAGDYQNATQAATNAVAADSGNGKLQLYLAQCQFAVGDFAASADSLTTAFELLPQSQWGLVIENFRQFYKRNDYVPQVEKLLAFSEQPENRSLAHALQAYHYHYLGHPDAATDQLRAALRDPAPPRLAVELKKILLSGQTASDEALPSPLSGNE
jgi:hypothetical protein